MTAANAYEVRCARTLSVHFPKRCNRALGDCSDPISFGTLSVRSIVIAHHALLMHSDSAFTQGLRVTELI